LLVGAPGYNNGGDAYIFLGSSSGISTLVAWTDTYHDTCFGDATASYRYGYAVKIIGDIKNDDGYSDWVVSNPKYCSAFYETQRGIVYWYEGSSSIGSTLHTDTVSLKADTNNVSDTNNAFGEGFGYIDLGGTAKYFLVGCPGCYSNPGIDPYAQVFAFGWNTQLSALALKWQKQASFNRDTTGGHHGYWGRNIEFGKLDGDADGLDLLITASFQHYDYHTGYSAFSFGDVTEDWDASSTAYDIIMTWTTNDSFGKWGFDVVIDDADGDGYDDILAGAPSWALPYGYVGFAGAVVYHRGDSDGFDE
jgi:hypothetical protein